MSKTTFEFHYGKHHAAYLNNLNGQIAGKDLEKLSIEEVMLKTWNGGSPGPEFNNAAQVVNHTFFWESMSPNGGGKPSGKVAEAIERDLGGYDKFVEAFKAAGATQFGSGWAWLSVNKQGKLEVTKTPNAENPWVHGNTPILTMDVWEHAYYLDVQNRRPDFISNFIENLIDWQRVEQRYLAATNAASSGGACKAARLSSGPPCLHGFVCCKASAQGPSSACVQQCSTRALVLYSAALEYARSERYDVARRVFRKLCTSECPSFVKPWVSWAQMEKRCIPCGDERRWAASRSVLQQGLERNRDAPPLLQAWGLLEMQRGNLLGAVMLLDRSAALEPRNRPVLRWKPVVEARKTVGERRGCGRLQRDIRAAASGGDSCTESDE
ncbi:superoxide dismutase [Fe] [Chlorella sorokiniana]|uniref:Superoxide dismutase [Fe] n=1 Tax=Chlorella sorokiniana TaxID=3076 RepID=A0A2P6TVM1_CHLSO|nr:superoxide dismutase [Fe] [Chlorella sorokiniana]|eukprot:PRW58106.1 superoxide dismutase [Fe] [Chlorella sorokiniana]